MTDEVLQTAAPILKEHHFIRKGSTWYYDEPETILIINFQREFGEQYFINAAVWIKGLGPDVAFPKENHSQIRARLSTLSRKYPDSADFLNIRKRVSTKVRRQEIESALTKTVIPFLSRYNSRQKIYDSLTKLEKKAVLWMPSLLREKFIKMCAVP